MSLPPHLDALNLGFLGGAALLAGAINAVAGGGSLLSFPALLLVGYPALTANVTNSVALLPGYVGGSVAYRRELVGQGHRMRRLGAISLGGAVAGAWLLVAGPASVFQRLVPWLILASCALLAAQSAIARRIVTHPHGASSGRLPPALIASQVLAAVYGAYFGAGVGVIMLAVLGIFVVDTLQRINALKGALSLVISVVAVVYFAVFGSVAWLPVLVMGPASFLGGLAGVTLARRLNDRVLRWFVISFGVAVAVRLAL